MFKIIQHIRDVVRIAKLVDRPEFGGVETLAEKVELALDRLSDARVYQFKNRQRYLTAEDRLLEVTRERDAYRTKYEAMTSGLRQNRRAA